VFLANLRGIETPAFSRGTKLPYSFLANLRGIETGKTWAGENRI